MNRVEMIKREEDLFPKNFTDYEERPYGILFYNIENKTSYDSNHALIYKENVDDLGKVLKDITLFYNEKDIHPCLYQSLEDEGYFKENEEIFNEYNYNVWTEEPANIMILSEKSILEKSKKLDIKILTEWDERIATDVCIPSDEIHEIEVFRNSILNLASKVFVGYYNGEAAAICHIHVSENGCCRYDYILVSINQRKQGFGREMLSYITEYCREHQIENCFQWPAHKTSERMCYDAGFRSLFSAEVGRASYIKE